MIMLNKLLTLAKTLRGPKGCPWDKKQTLAKYPKRLIEESEEILEAINKKDWQNLEEEMGDVLFNLVMMAQIAEEEKLFSMQSIIDRCEQKIIDRHSWVFGEDEANTPEEALDLWKKNKAKEKTL